MLFNQECHSPIETVIAHRLIDPDILNYQHI